jgi:hypothetical protein
MREKHGLPALFRSFRGLYQAAMISAASALPDLCGMRLHRILPCAWLTSLLLAALACGQVLADAPTAAIQTPSETRLPVNLEQELGARWQAGGEIAVFTAEDGAIRVGRRATPPADAAEEQARRIEHFALARKLNLVTAPRVAPMALPLAPEQVELLQRFALSDAGAVWFREMADDTLRLFNQGYLDYDASLWQAHLDGAPRPALSALLTGRLSEAGMFAQDVSVFRIFAYDGIGSMAAAASVRMGRRGFRCQFQMSGEPVDPFAILSHEFGHSRYGDPRSAGLPLGEAQTVARYENPVRLRNGFPPRLVYYLRIEPSRPPITRNPLLLRLLAWREPPKLRLADLESVDGLYCECADAPGLHDCLALLPEASSPALPDAGLCELRWVAVRVAPRADAEAP